MGMREGEGATAMECLDWTGMILRVNVAEIGKRKKTPSRYVYMFSCVTHVYLCVYIYIYIIYIYIYICNDNKKL